MKEIWKDVIGYEGLYKVSSLGAIKSLLFNDALPVGYVFKPTTNTGYCQVGLRKNGVRKYFKVHRLVAASFIKNNKNKKQVNHIDGNKLNNNVNNLEWVTPKENIRHSINNNLRKSWDNHNNPKCKLNKKQVLFIRNSKLSALELSKIFNISSVNVYDIKNLKTWKYL